MKRTLAGCIALVVEDDPDFAAFLADCLRGRGLEVDIAMDATHAMEHAIQRRPDIITLDIQMPGRSGLHFFRRIRAMDSLRETPVVVVTGLTRDDRDWDLFLRTFLDEAGVAPPATYLEKPVGADQLAETVCRILTGDSSGSELQ